MLDIVNDWQELETKHLMLKYRKTAYSNMFLDQDKMIPAIAGGMVRILTLEDSTWITVSDHDLDQVFFVAADESSFGAGFDILTRYVSRRVKINIFCKDRKNDLLMSMSRLGLNEYSMFERYQRIIGTEEYYASPTNEILVATNNHVNLILDLFKRCFDPVDDEIPSCLEMEYLIKNRDVRIVLRGEKLVGCLITKTSGSLSTLQHIAVDELYRRQKIASDLVRYYLSDCTMRSISRILLWVRSTNESAKSYYRSFGFHKQGLRKYVFLKGDNYA
jgi:ribosomal protein S18 acetylase RimI-like enzyme